MLRLDTEREHFKGNPNAEVRLNVWHNDASYESLADTLINH
jgi:hypothetical protein